MTPAASQASAAIEGLAQVSGLTGPPPSMNSHNWIPALPTR
jgi:hypothetical protein